MAKGDDIQERLIEFSAGIVKLCEGLPKTTSGRHIAKPLLRCGTAPAAHYAEARGAESRNDFIHKLKLCSKELNETQVWLKIITRSNLMTPTKISSIGNECVELNKIINASIKTARSKSSSGDAN